MSPSTRAAFRDLLADPEPTVRRRAVAATGRIGDRTLVKSFVHALGDSTTTGAAFAAFEAAGDGLTDAIELALVDAPLVINSRTAAALAVGDGQNGGALLCWWLVHDRTGCGIGLRGPSRPAWGAKRGVCPLP